ncbi:hypothetical protein ACSBR1_005292 [Camellia fascicularis]
MARRTAYVVGRVPLLRKRRVLRSAAAGGDCGGAREERPPVLVVHTAASTRRRVSDADRLRRRLRGLVAGRISETDGKQRNGVRVGAADGGAGPRGGGRVCVALRVELDFGELVVRCSDRDMADLRRATDECS